MSPIFFQPPAGRPWGRIQAFLGYLAAGRLLHVITMIALVSVLLVATFTEGRPLKIPITVGVGLMAFFSQLDARSRYQEYKRARDQLAAYGPNRRIFRSLSGSRCQRDAVLAAATQLGHADACRSHFAAAGYRWHHLLPDFVSHHPGFLLSPAFLRATFFAPTYHPRYDWKVGCTPPPGALTVIGKKAGPFKQACRMAK